jgi:tRNA pseudouridine38-40 synthase
MTRWLVRFGYDGAPFRGWARQPGARTVEGELRGGLVRYGLTSSPDLLRLEVASRTDRGVSARGNAFALSTELDGMPLLRALNGISADIYCTAALPVAEQFRVRSASRRIYRYYEPGRGRDFDSWKIAAAVLAGEVDVRSFGRSKTGAEPVWRTIESVTVTRRRQGAVIEVRAPSFVWGMVRKLVGALREHDAGRLTIARLSAGVRGQVRLSLPMAEPEGLVLWDVQYPLRWKYRWGGPNRRQQARRKSMNDALAVRAEVLRSLPTFDRGASRLPPD